MKEKTLRVLPLFLALALLANTVGAMAASSDRLADAVAETAEYMVETVKDPQVGSIGGEWAILGLARSGCQVPASYYQQYYDHVLAYVKVCKGELHEKKYTEYSRLIVALTAIGKDPADVGGYNLLTPLGDYEKTIWQGLNGPAWALIALDSGEYAMPQNLEAKTQATRELYIRRILDCRLSDGGWSLLGGTSGATAEYGVSNPDITGMVLQALANYQDRPEVKKATAEALDCMSKQQNSTGGFTGLGDTGFEGCVQMLVALSALGISPEDARFVKGGTSFLEYLMTFYQPGKGFSHAGSGGNQMASEQGLYGLVAVQRLRDGKPGLYHINDPLRCLPSPENALKKGEGLAGKQANVKPQLVVNPGKTFEDISAHPNQLAIEALAARGILGGKTNTTFAPDATMTRAEFAAVVVRALGLTPKAVTVFADVPANAWYAASVGTAYTMGIVGGTDAAHFNPCGTITRQEAAVMLARAAKLCGMDTAYSAAAARDVLAQFADYTESGEWARPALAFCCGENILSQDRLELLPTQTMRRCEIAQMVLNLLNSANLC